MAREPMVTRTIVTTKAVVLCMDVNSGEPCNREVTLPRTYADDSKLLKKAKDIIEQEDGIKAVHIVSKEEVETLYGMKEQDFIANAKVLPPRTATDKYKDYE